MGNKSKRVCSVCNNAMKNLTDLKYVKVFSVRGPSFELQMCHQHYFKFFLTGQYQFLIDYRAELTRWMLSNDKVDALAEMKDIIARAEAYRKQILLKQAA